tara:strand:- start:4063 stop:5043 length:981 start_codon:yes stop_codon:yes gene_type:complete
MANKSQKAKFIISEDAWNTMQQYAKLAYDKDGNEISGICLVKKTKHPIDDTDVWELFEPCILKQENSTTNTILDKDVLPPYYIDMAVKHGTDIRYCWWHSHHTMDAFWSGTDQNEIEAWKNSSWSLALVINLRQEYCLNVSTWDPVEHSEDVPLEIIRPIPEPSAKMIKEYKDKCSNIVTAVSTYNHKKYGYGYGYNQKNGQLSMIRSEGIPEDLVLKWGAGDLLDDYAKVYSQAVDGLDDLNSEFLIDRIKYAQYKKKVQACNKQLKKVNARFQIKIYPKAKLIEKCSTDCPDEFFEYDNDETEMAYMSVKAHQESLEYGGYGWV